MGTTTSSSRGPSTFLLECLLERIRAGDESAVEDLIREAYPRALRLTRYILRGDIGAVAQGLTDDVCLLSYEKFAAALRGGLKRPFACLKEMTGYLNPIIRRTAVDEVRRILGPKHRTQFPAARLEAEPPAPTSARRRLGFYEMIEDLPPAQREVIELRYLHEYTNVEIAQILGIGRMAVAGLLAAGLLRLRADYRD